MLPRRLQSAAIIAFSTVYMALMSAVVHHRNIYSKKALPIGGAFFYACHSITGFVGVFEYARQS